MDAPIVTRSWYLLKTAKYVIVGAWQKRKQHVDLPTVWLFNDTRWLRNAQHLPMIQWQNAGWWFFYSLPDLGGSTEQLGGDVLVEQQYLYRIQYLLTEQNILFISLRTLSEVYAVFIRRLAICGGCFIYNASLNTGLDASAVAWQSVIIVLCQLAPQTLRRNAH